MSTSPKLASTTNPTSNALTSKPMNPFWVEFKGFETASWRIKRKLWLHYGPGPLEIYKKGNNGVKLTETLTPK